MRTEYSTILKVMLSAASILTTFTSSLVSQQAVPTIEGTLTSIDDLVRQGGFLEAERLQGRLVGLIFDEMKSNAPKNFEPSHVVVPVAASITEVLAQTDAIRQATRKPDLILARDLAVHLSFRKLIGDSVVNPAAELQVLESETVGASGFKRFLLLPKLARAALDSGDFGKANSYCTEALAASTSYRKQLTGEAVHHCNIVQGRIRLDNNDIAGASAYLMFAGQTSGSPSLGTFGPNMLLARDLLIRGERSSVLKYLSECSAFWKADGGKLNLWANVINEGKLPDFGPNLKY